MSNFEIVKFWKKLHVSDSEWAQEINGAIRFSAGQILVTSDLRGGYWHSQVARVFI